MMNLNQILFHSIYTAFTESSEMKFNSKKEREEWEGKRTAEIFKELEQKYFPNKKYTILPDIGITFGK